MKIRKLGVGMQSFIVYCCLWTSYTYLLNQCNERKGGDGNLWARQMNPENVVTILRKEKLYECHTLVNQMDTESPKILQYGSLDGILKGRAGCNDSGWSCWAQCQQGWKKSKLRKGIWGLGLWWIWRWEGDVGGGVKSRERVEGSKNQYD